VNCRVIIANDPDGKVINLVAGAIGAGVGFVVGFGINAAIQAQSGKDFSWKSAVATGVGGAISGGIGGLTMGGSLLVQAGVGGIGASVAGGAVTRQILGEKQTAEAAAIDGLVGAVTFGMGKGISSALSKSSSAQMSSAIRELEKETLDGSVAAVKTVATSKVAQTIANRLTNNELRKLPKDIASVLREQKLLFKDKSTIAVLQGELDGKVTTLLTATDEKTVNALRTLQQKGLIDKSLEIIDATRILGQSEKTGAFVKSFGSSGREQMFVHAEQTLAVEATKRGVSNSRVATSINACKDVCTPTFGPGGDLYPEILHLNPNGS
jgi:hypothetical protein